MALMLCIQALLTFLYGVDTSTLSIVTLLATNCSNVSICSNNNKIFSNHIIISVYFLSNFLS